MFEARTANDVTRACERIVEDHASRARVFSAFADRFGRDRVALYVMKKMSPSIRSVVAMIDAVRWHIRVTRATPASCLFLFSHAFAGILCEDARTQGVQAQSYPHPGRWPRRLGRVMRRLLWPVLSMRGLLFRPSSLDREPSIGALFNGKGIGLDPRFRTDLFWLIPPSIRRDRVVICFDRTDVPVTSDMVDRLNEAGIRAVAFRPEARRDPRIPLFRPGWRSLRTCLKWNAKIAWTLMSAWIRLREEPAIFADLMILFVRNYAWWIDFFEWSGIRIHIQNNEFSDEAVPLQAAIRELGGIGVGFQFSQLHVSKLPLAVCRDVYFAFGPAFREPLCQSHSAIGAIVYCGYITDLSFAAVQSGAKLLRSRLRAAGAEFILCFFDENTAAAGIAYASHRRTADLYRRMIETVLADPSLGLIIKPKHPRSLFIRMPEIKPLVEKAVATGRCVLIEEGARLTDVLPTEAAQAGDAAVALLRGGTVALESFLSGVPTVFLDIDGLVTRPEYRWPHQVVYSSWEELRAALSAHRTSPGGSRFGDLSEGIEKKDPFRDGGASGRMAQYLQWLLESLDNDSAPDSAVASASQLYRRQWGQDRIGEGVENREGTDSNRRQDRRSRRPVLDRC